MEAGLSKSDIQRHLLVALQAYWPTNGAAIKALPVIDLPFPNINGPLRVTFIELPEWAREWGVNGKIAIPVEACSQSTEPSWQTTDWWLAAFLMLECWHERVWEDSHGPIHSYSYHLLNWDDNVWDRAWVNRIALFLRAWATKNSNLTADSLFGPLPVATFTVTHDVDAITKTLAVRLKQFVFNAVNAGRAIVARDPARVQVCLKQAARMLFSQEDWWALDKLVEMEKTAGIRSRFNFYADLRPKTAKRWLFDPGYKITETRLAHFISTIQTAGWTVGLHPSFDAWKNYELISVQKQNLELVLQEKVLSCRQHWLRFSWCKTWSAQEKAGIEHDTTLMFNDRPGLRCAAALQWHPWDRSNNSPHQLDVLPTVIMDSHLYDYRPMTGQERLAAINHWVDEVKEVGGSVAFLWHPHTLTDDYGWQSGFAELLDLIKAKDL